MRNIYKQVYSDHFKCFLTLKDLPRAQERREEELVVCNLSKEGGLGKYKVLIDKFNEVLQDIVNDDKNMENKMQEFEKIHNRIKFKSFGKVTIGRNLQGKKSYQGHYGGYK